MTKRVLTLEEVSDRTRIPMTTLRFYRFEGRGPRLWKLGGRLVAYDSDVEAWIEEQYTSTSTQPPAA